MKFKHCLMLSVFFASLLIATLIRMGTPMNAGLSAPEKGWAVAKHGTDRPVVLPARHTPGEQTPFHHLL